MTGRGSMLAGLILLLAAPGAASAAQTDDRMLSFVARVEVGADGTVAVTERIRYRAGKPRHGDFRILPVWYSLVGPDGRSDGRRVRVAEVDYQSATVDGQPMPFTTERGDSDATVVLRVGAADREFTGEHDVHLRYRMRGLVTAPAGRPELSWDAFDIADPVAIDRAEVTVTAPGPIGEVRCAVGAPGDEWRRSCTSARADGPVAEFVAEHVRGHLPMRINAVMPPTVPVAAPSTRELPNFGVPGDGRNSGISPFTVGLLVIIGLAAASAVGRAFYRSRRR